MPKRPIAAAAAGVLAMGMLSAAPQTPTPPATPAQPPADRIVITGMIPVPAVGAGAPYHSVTELGRMGTDAKQEYSRATHDIRLASESDACRDPKDTNVMSRPKAPTPETAGQHTTFHARIAGASLNMLAHPVEFVWTTPTAHQVFPLSADLSWGAL